jgi:PP-loop superfamily ATP-utilizing enzyme
MPRALEPATADVIDRQLKALGFKFVTVDVKGYRTGSLNEAIVLKQV